MRRLPTRSGNRVKGGKNVKYLDIGGKFLDGEGNLSKDIMPDYLHPNAKGYGRGGVYLDLDPEANANGVGGAVVKGVDIEINIYS